MCSDYLPKNLHNLILKANNTMVAKSQLETIIKTVKVKERVINLEECIIKFTKVGFGRRRRRSDSEEFG